MTLIYLLVMIGATPQFGDMDTSKSIALASSPKRKPIATNATPLNNPGEWATQNDYPSLALSQERYGTTGFRLYIGKNGIVENCEITLSSGHADLDATTCRVVAVRARFSPALDKKGNPTEGTYSNRVRWQIPNLRDPNFNYPIPKPSNTTIRMEVSADGTVTNCNIRSNVPEIEKGSCGEKTIFIPYLDAEGKPKRVQVIISTSIKVIEMEDTPASDKILELMK
jgi:TonB family protein